MLPWLLSWIMFDSNVIMIVVMFMFIVIIAKPRRHRGARGAEARRISTSIVSSSN